MPPEGDKDGHTKVVEPSQGNVSPETDFFCKLTDCHGISQEQALSYISVLKAWVGGMLDGYAKQEGLNNLRARVKEIENNFARKGDVEKIAREVFWFWGKIVMGVVSGVLLALGAAIWFFWEKIHPFLVNFLKAQ